MSKRIDEKTINWQKESCDFCRETSCTIDHCQCDCHKKEEIKTMLPNIHKKLSDFIGETDKKEIPEHDCHASPDDGCEVCSKYLEGPDEDTAYEVYRDSVDEEYQTAYEAGQVEVSPENLDTQEKEELLINFNEKEK